MIKFDLNELKKLADERLITSRRHPTLPLLIHNYTRRCQYEKVWTPTTTQCRGLITDLEGNVVALPMRKFFNLAEHEAPESKLPPLNWDQSFIVTEKYDGALGILYQTPDGPQIATRGSFESPQAIEANRILKEKCYELFPAVDTHTYLFEIICDESRIIVNYGGIRDLVLIDILSLDVDNGRLISYVGLCGVAKVIGCPVVKRMPLYTFADVATYAKSNVKNEEGVVIRFDDGSRVKVKSADYCRLHKLLTGCTPRTIWEALSSGTSMECVLQEVPDDFREYVRKIETDLRMQYSELIAQAKELFEMLTLSAGRESERKDLALQFVKHKELAPLLFAMLDGKDVSKKIWRMIHPAASEPFK